MVAISWRPKPIHLTIIIASHIAPATRLNLVLSEYIYICMLEHKHIHILDDPL